MYRLLTSLLVVTILMASCCCGYAAGAYGHFIIASRAIDGIMSGKQAVPDDLKAALADPECRKAYCGGAVAPDICEDASHYGNTGDLVRAMGAKAMSNLESAKKLGDPAKIKQAQIQLAFSYGWLSHCAADVNIHPFVNAIAGDSYRYCTESQKAIHAGQEVQLDKYLAANYLKPGEKYAVTVPEDFLSEFVGLKPATLRHNLRVLNIRVTGELAGKELVYLNKDKVLKPKWDDCVKDCIRDSETLVGNPGLMGNWDLDSGPISTNDFRDLRMLVKQANGGKLPADWSSHYLDYYRKAMDIIAKSKGDIPDSTISKPGAKPVGAVDFKLPALPKMHKQPTEADKVNLRAWRDKCVTLLNKEVEDDPLRLANKNECLNLVKENRTMECSKCGKATLHWWIEPSWSCSVCEMCIMPQDVKRADGLTHREFAAQRMKLYTDKIAEVEAIAR
jgi:hypothetical protein